MIVKQLQATIDKGAAFLATVQTADGSFHSLSSPVRTPFTPRLIYKTTFTPALILSALAALNDDAIQDVRRKLATWLQAQKSPHWSFNYWSLTAPERENLPYPDDLDDTFCALIALYRHNPASIDQTALAKAVKLLVAAETQTGGPYRTWLTTGSAPKIWHDVDLAVNANVAGFLRLVAEPLPNLTQLIEQAIANRTFSSPYYPSGYPTIYYIARAYDGPLTTQLASHLINKRRSGWWGSPLPTALAITALVRLGRADACDAALERLIAAQQPNGSWLPEAFCIDPAVQNKTYYNGAAALTTAFALEALACFRPTAKPRPTSENKTDKTVGIMYDSITATLKHDSKHFSPALQQQLKVALKRTQVTDHDRSITLLPYFFNQSLIKPLPATSSELFVQLGSANMYGWTAYTVYDDFLDNEGNPRLLSAANVALRYSLQYFYQALPDDAAFQSHTTQTFNTVDGTNTWELTHCRMTVTDKTITIGQLPRYPETLSLADRSIGHTLTPLAVLAASGIQPTDRRAQHVSLALRHYIAARQLNDDLHDWEQDLRAGIITYVVTAILGGLRIKPGTHSLAKLIPRMQKEFWHRTLPAICRTITRHTALARRNAHQSGLLKPDNVITQLTASIDDTVTKTLKEQSDAQAFLNAYTTAHPEQAS